MFIAMDDPDMTEGECPNCHSVICASCQVIWHQGKLRPVSDTLLYSFPRILRFLRLFARVDLTCEQYQVSSPGFEAE